MPDGHAGESLRRCCIFWRLSPSFMLKHAVAAQSAHRHPLQPSLPLDKVFAWYCARGIDDMLAAVHGPERWIWL